MFSEDEDKKTGSNYQSSSKMLSKQQGSLDSGPHGNEPNLSMYVYRILNSYFSVLTPSTLFFTGRHRMNLPVFWSYRTLMCKTTAGWV